MPTAPTPQRPLTPETSVRIMAAFLIWRRHRLFKSAAGVFPNLARPPTLFDRWRSFRARRRIFRQVALAPLPQLELVMRTSAEFGDWFKHATALGLADATGGEASR